MHLYKHIGEEIVWLFGSDLVGSFSYVSLTNWFTAIIQDNLR